MYIYIYIYSITHHTQDGTRYLTLVFLVSDAPYSLTPERTRRAHKQE